MSRKKKKKKKYNKIDILKRARGIRRELAKKKKRFHLWWPKSNTLDKNKRAIENKRKCRKRVDGEEQ